MRQPRIIVTAFATCLTLSFQLPMPAHAQARKVTVQLDWVVNGAHIGFFVAKAKGLYAAKGLDADINRGFGSADTAKVVAAGKADFGVLTIPGAITSRASGVPVVAVAVIYGKSPESIVSIEPKAIRQPKETEGKSFAEAPGGTMVAIWPAFAKLVGINADKVKYVAIDPSAKLAAFFSGQVDFMFGFRPGLDDVAILRAQKDGKKLLFLPWEDYGWKSYGIGIATSDQVLNQNSKVVADFIDATLDGYRQAMENLEQALDILIKDNPEIDRNAARLATLFTLDGLLTESGREHGLGYIEPARVEFLIELLSKLLNFAPPKAESVYTDQFIQKKPVTISPAMEAELAKIR